MLCKDLKPSDAKASHSFNTTISHTPVTLTHQNVSIIEIAGYLLMSILQDIIVIWLMPSLSYTGIRLCICGLGTAWFEIQMAAAKLSGTTHTCGAHPDQSA